MKIIGDVHGKLQEYKKIVDSCDESICVGDFGFKEEWDWHRENIQGGHWINPGNHDYIPDVSNFPSMGNYNCIPHLGIFTIRGADSIDKHHRTPGIDWFENEELDYIEGVEALDRYLEFKPKIVVSHDCPQSVMEYFFKYATEKSRTRQLLQVMFEQHQPELWVFGHHHWHRDEIINGTRFICLDELETFEI